MKKFTPTMLVFLVFIGAFFLLNLFLPNRVFSEKENRYLAQRPDFTWQSLFSGRYTTDFETYITDQFTGRDGWTSLKALSEQALGKRENNDVYLAADDTLIQRFDEPDWQQLDKNLTAVYDFATVYSGPVYFMAVPSAAQVWQKKLPAHAPNYDQSQLLAYCQEALGNTCHWVDCLSPLNAHQDEPIYYRTDHHWTTLGAYYGYQALLQAMARTPQEFNTLRTIQGFYGTSQAKAGIPFLPADEITVMVEPSADLKVISHTGEGESQVPLYDETMLNKRDKYAFFLGGNAPYLQIDTGITSGDRLLIFKDSYANCLIPFLTTEFSTIDVIDLRFYKMKISDFIAETQPDAVLFCYSLAGFSSDANLFQVTR